MRALTLHRPWPSIMVHPDPEKRKPIENRKWAPPAWMIGEQLALHAGKKWDRHGAEFIQGETGIRYQDSDCPSGVIVGVGVVDRVFHLTSDGELFNYSDPLAMSPWAFGPYCWVLRDVVALAEPVPSVGHQGLWPVPPSAMDLVLPQLRIEP